MDKSPYADAYAAYVVVYENTTDRCTMTVALATPQDETYTTSTEALEALLYQSRTDCLRGISSRT